jgi:hypothetical protein
VIEPFARDLEEATEGPRHDRGHAGARPAPRHFDLVANEVADMAFSVHGYTPGRFTLTEIGELPFTHNNTVVNSLAYWNTYERYMMEATSTRACGCSACGPTALSADHAGDLLTSLDAVEGKRIRVPGTLVEQVTTTLGMVPISSSVTDSYEQISRG